MSKIDRQMICEALKEAMNREELHTRQAAVFLNLHPVYLSMAKNPKMWDSMSKPSWRRLEEWLSTREPISQFKIPEGEEIYVPKEKTRNAMDGDKNTAIEKAEKKARKESRPKIQEPKSVKLILNKAEIESLKQRLDKLESEVMAQWDATLLNIKKTNEQIEEIRKNILDILSGCDKCKARIALISDPEAIPERKKTGPVIFFQKNIYKP